MAERKTTVAYNTPNRVRDHAWATNIFHYEGLEL